MQITRFIFYITLCKRSYAFQLKCHFKTHTVFSIQNYTGRNRKRKKFILFVEYFPHTFNLKLLVENSNRTYFQRTQHVLCNFLVVESEQSIL